MRIRNAAVAGATALAVAFSGVAAAEDTNTTPGVSKDYYEPTGDQLPPNKPGELPINKGDSNLSSKFGDGLDKFEAASGNDIFGVEKAENLPGWAKLFYASGILGAIGTVIGTIIAAVNYGLNEGFIKF